VFKKTAGDCGKLVDNLNTRGEEALNYLKGMSFIGSPSPRGEL
jgi:hypothetical protein